MHEPSIPFQLLTLAQSLQLDRSGASAGGSVTGGESLVLMSWWKPTLILALVVGWAWVVANVFDKDAARFYLPRRKLNIVHLAVGVAAVAIVLLSPSFWITLPAVFVLFASHLLGYAFKRNRDHRVPAGQQWTMDFSKMQAAREEREKAKNRKHIAMDFRGPSGLIAPPAKETPEAAVRQAAEQLIADALEIRSSRIEVGPTGDNQTYTTGYIVDGVMAQKKTAPPASALAVVDFFKSSSGLDVNDRRRRLRADMAAEMGPAKRKLRIISSGGSGGQRLTIVFDPESQVRFDLDALGFLDSQLKEVRALVDEGKGVVLIATPPQQGRTSTMYTILRAHDAYTSNVQTIEMEPADTIEGIRSNIFNPLQEGQEYSNVVRSILRRDPNVVAVAELPDTATAVEVCRADHERTRVYVGLRADNAITALQAFAKAVGDPELVGKALHGVVAQRLVRKLCANCRIEYQPTPDLLKKLGVPAEKAGKLYKKGGQVLIKNKPEVCPVCQGAGYMGQEGVFEVYQLGPEERALIAANDVNGLRAALRKKRLPSIQDAALQKVFTGVTSVEEVARITAAEQRPAPRPAPAPQQPAPQDAAKPKA